MHVRWALVAMAAAVLSAPGMAEDLARVQRQSRPPQDPSHDPNYSVFVRALPPNANPPAGPQPPNSPIRFANDFAQPAQQSPPPPQFSVRNQPQHQFQQQLPQQQPQQHPQQPQQQQQLLQFQFNRQQQPQQQPLSPQQLLLQQQYQQQQQQQQQQQFRQFQQQNPQHQPQISIQQPQQQFQQQHVFNNQQQHRQQQPPPQQQFINSQQQQQQFPQQHQQQVPQQRQQFSFSDGNQQANVAFAFPQQAAVTPSTTPQPPPAFQSFPRHSFSVSSSSSSEDALRQGKIVGSIQPPAQVIQKSPASEIESSKQAEAKDKAAKGKDKDKDEYVVYYYYYYDDDNKKNNLSLNFDDVPSLEGFDKTDGSKLKGKSSTQRLASPNPQNRFEPKTVTTSPPSGQQPAPPPAFPLEQGVTTAPQTVTQVSVSVSVSEGTHALLPSQPFEAKRPPLAGPPSLEFTGAKLVPDPGVLLGPAPDVRGLVTPQGSSVSTVPPSTDTHVVNEISGRKGADLLTTSAETTTPTTTTSTTEPPTTLAPTTTTTEEPTTTTEKTKRPFGNRRRFGGAHGAGPHIRGPGSRKSHTTSTTTTPATSSTRRLLGGLRRNRPTPRSPSSRLQFGRRPSPIHSRHQKEEEPEEEEGASSPADAEPTTTTAASTSNGKKRFGGGSRFGGKSSRTRGSSTATASSTTAAPKRPVARPSSGALFGRTNRGSRPRTPFTRHRPGHKKVEEEEKPEENEESSPATTPENKEEASAASTETASKHEETAAAASESEATSEDSHATEAPAVTPESKPAHGRNRFGSRPRPPLFGGRPRPTLGR
nr:flocculation protein FLO11-like [Rhipicephalus microplus]